MSLTVAIGDPPHSVAGVLDRLTAIQVVTGPIGGDLRERDGLGAFNHLYRRITGKVLEDLEAGRFHDPLFLETLDIEFAKRYFEALIRFEAGDVSAPRCWTVLLQNRSTRGLQDLQFATAGVNAHVNYDLPFALLTTWAAVGYEETSFPQNQQSRDYLRVNNIFHAEMTSLRLELEDPMESWLDRGHVSHLLSTLSDEAVVADRSAAWMVAERLHRRPADRATAERDLDSITAKLSAVLLHT